MRVEKNTKGRTVWENLTEYFKEGRVHLRKREDNLITAVVDGEELYNVQVRLSEKGVEDCFCTCPYFLDANSPQSVFAILSFSST